MKKGRVIFIFVLLTVFYISNLVGAASSVNIGATDIKDFTSKAIEGAKALALPFFEFVLGKAYTEDPSDFFLAKSLLLILMIIIISVVLRKVPVFENKKGLSFLLAIIVSILAVRYISDNQLVLGILLPYGTLGVALTTLFPFAIYTFFVYNNDWGSVGRRLSFILFGIIMFVLWISRRDELSPQSNWIYIGVLIATVLLLLFDRQVRGFFGMHELNVFMRHAQDSRISRLQAEYQDIANVDSPHADRRRRVIRRQLQREGANVEGRGLD